jgi:sugar-specific transcriptional regulator TrmB
MYKDPKDLEIKRLRKELKKKADRIKKFKTSEEYRDMYDDINRQRQIIRRHLDHINSLRHEILIGKEKYVRLEATHKKLQEKFEANFRFHEYLRDALSQTANLMEKHDAIREQGKAVQERVQAASRTRRTRKPNGASAGSPQL